MPETQWTTNRHIDYKNCINLVGVLFNPKIMTSHLYNLSFIETSNEEVS